MSLNEKAMYNDLQKEIRRLTKMAAILIERKIDRKKRKSSTETVSNDAPLGERMKRKRRTKAEMEAERYMEKGLAEQA